MWANEATRAGTPSTPPRHPASESEATWCSSGLFGAATVIPGAVFAGAREGTLRAYSTADGEVLWEYNTMQEYETVNGVRARGGSIGGHGLSVTNRHYPGPARPIPSSEPVRHDIRTALKTNSVGIFRV